MGEPKHILVIDGGGSKTAAALLTPSGEELARCRVGPANLYRDPVAGLAEIGRAWEELCRLAGFQPDREAAGARYEQLRRRLLAIFSYRHCPHPEELADETLDRVARKLRELGGEFIGSDPARYVFGVWIGIALMISLAPGASTAPGFSTNACLPASTVAIRCAGRKCGGVARIT